MLFYPRLINLFVNQLVYANPGPAYFLVERPGRSESSGPISIGGSGSGSGGSSLQQRVPTTYHIFLPPYIFKYYLCAIVHKLSDAFV
jgi:hypothetical protein